MNELFMLSKKQLNRIKPYFPLSHGVPRVDDLRVVSGIIYVIKNGLQWKEPRVDMARTRRYITDLYAGAGWVCSIVSLRNWRENPARLTG